MLQCVIDNTDSAVAGSALHRSLEVGVCGMICEYVPKTIPIDCDHICNGMHIRRRGQILECDGKRIWPDDESVLHAIMNGGFSTDYVGYYDRWAVAVDTGHRRAKLIMLDEMRDVHECGSVSGTITMHHTHFTLDNDNWCVSCTYLGPYIEWTHAREKCRGAMRCITCRQRSPADMLVGSLREAAPSMFSLWRRQKPIWTGKLPCETLPHVVEAHAPDGVLYVMLYCGSYVHILKFSHDVIVSTDAIDGSTWQGDAGQSCSYDFIEFVWAGTCLQITHRGSYVKNRRVCIPAF